MRFLLLTALISISLCAIGQTPDTLKFQKGVYHYYVCLNNPPVVLWEDADQADFEHIHFHIRNPNNYHIKVLNSISRTDEIYWESRDDEYVRASDYYTLKVKLWRARGVRCTQFLQLKYVLNVDIHLFKMKTISPGIKPSEKRSEYIEQRYVPLRLHTKMQENDLTVTSESRTETDTALVFKECDGVFIATPAYYRSNETLIQVHSKRHGVVFKRYLAPHHIPNFQKGNEIIGGFELTKDTSFYEYRGYSRSTLEYIDGLYVMHIAIQKTYEPKEIESRTDSLLKTIGLTLEKEGGLYMVRIPNERKARETEVFMKGKTKYFTIEPVVKPNYNKDQRHWLNNSATLVFDRTLDSAQIGAQLEKYPVEYFIANQYYDREGHRVQLRFKTLTNKRY